jgi:hypothetical protein
MNVHLTQGSRSVCNGVETTFPVRPDEPIVTHGDRSGSRWPRVPALGHHPAGAIKSLGFPVAAQRVAMAALPAYAAFLYATVTSG